MTEEKTLLRNYEFSRKNLLQANTKLELIYWKSKTLSNMIKILEYDTKI